MVSSTAVRAILAEPALAGYVAMPRKWRAKRNMKMTVNRAGSSLRLFLRSFGKSVLQQSVDPSPQAVEVGARFHEIAGAALDRFGGKNGDRAGDLRGIFIRRDLSQFSGNQLAARNLTPCGGTHALLAGCYGLGWCPRCRHASSRWRLKGRPWVTPALGPDRRSSPQWPPSR